MTLRWYTTVVDSPDPRALADWWAEALGWQKVYEMDDEVTIIPGYATPELVAGMSWERVPPGLVFVKVDEHKAVKNRLHLDLHAGPDRREAEVARLEGLGAKVEREVAEQGGAWTVLTDPEGNEFCVS